MKSRFSEFVRRLTTQADAERAAMAHNRLSLKTLRNKLCCKSETLFHSRVRCGMLSRILHIDVRRGAEERDASHE
jgi:hypothetical protein